MKVYVLNKNYFFKLTTFDTHTIFDFKPMSFSVACVRQVTPMSCVWRVLGLANPEVRKKRRDRMMCLALDTLRTSRHCLI